MDPVRATMRLVIGKLDEMQREIDRREIKYGRIRGDVVIVDGRSLPYQSVSGTVLRDGDVVAVGLDDDGRGVVIG